MYIKQTTMGKLKLAVLFFLLFTCLPHNTVLAQLSSKEVDKLVNNAMQKFNVAGVAVAIVKDGKPIHAKGYGVKSVDTKAKVDEHTLFAIASNSKAFTTAALAILEDRGKLKWTDKVVDVIPEFKMYNDYVTQNFTIADLLTHRSGLGLGVGDLMHFPDGADFTIDDIIKSFQYFKPQSAFRTKWDYDNLLYMVAGEVIKRVSGMEWGDFVTNNIFKPLQMNETFSSIHRVTNSNQLAVPHSNSINNQLRTINHYMTDPEKMNGAAGAIISNVSDLSKWLITRLNKGDYGKDLGQSLFSLKNHHKMWQIHTVTNARKSPRYNSHFAGYGLGWFLTDVKDDMMVSHTGGIPGMLSKVVMIPDLNLGIVVLTNTESGGGPAFSAITQTILDSYLGLDKFNWVDYYYEASQKRVASSDKVTTQVWKTVEKSKSVKIDANQYIGIYKDNWFGKVEVFLNNGKLWFKSYRSPKLNGPMRYYKGNAFAIRWEYQDMNADAFAIFSLDEEGKAQSIKMKGISPDIDFSFDFHDLGLKRVEHK